MSMRTVRVHTHTHDHGHDHDHAHTHDDAPLGVHSHTHHHSDGSEHSHAHVHEGEHAHEHGHEHGHEHHHHHEHAVGGDLDYGTGPARAHVPGMSQARMVQIEQDILSKNNAYAAANRQWFDERGIFALNLVSSPGSGKTTLLCKTIELLKGSVAINVVEGDQQTANDAERIRATGVPALQINTGKGCHLDGHMVGHAMQRLQPKDESLFLIENVGNLVCPAAFDLGEHHKVAILSVTEGEDKPLKYPDMFAAADVMLLEQVRPAALPRIRRRPGRSQRPPGQSQSDHLPRLGDQRRRHERLAGLDSIRAGSTARQALGIGRCAEAPGWLNWNGNWR